MNFSKSQAVPQVVRLLVVGLLVVLLQLGVLGSFGLSGGRNIADPQLCVAIDGSGSMSADDFGRQKEGLARALLDPAVILRDGSTEIVVIQFGTAGGARVEVSPTVVDSEAKAREIADHVRALRQGGGGTPMDKALQLCTAQITSSPTFGRTVKQVILLSTDGLPDDQGAAERARDAALAAGIDQVNVIPVGSAADLNFLERLATIPSPLRSVRSFEEAEDAFKNAMRGILDRQLVPTADVRVGGSPVGASRDPNTG